MISKNNANVDLLKEALTGGMAVAEALKKVMYNALDDNDKKIWISGEMYGRMMEMNGRSLNAKDLMDMKEDLN